jgi:hypothetical protein
MLGCARSTPCSSMKINLVLRGGGGREMADLSVPLAFECISYS